MADPFLGMIIMVGFNFAPNGWAFCNGQLLSISQNTALFALLGTTFGGNGVTTFALPDLRGRVPMGQFNGPGLTPRTLGEASGSESVTLTTSKMPPHNHLLTTPPTMKVKDAAGTQQSPVGNVLAKEAAGVTAIYTNPGAPYVDMSPDAISFTPGSATGIIGGGQPLEIVQPYVVLNFCIALQGVFPSRN